LGVGQHLVQITLCEAGLFRAGAFTLAVKSVQQGMTIKTQRITRVQINKKDPAIALLL
jgi:hypothetical protein